MAIEPPDGGGMATEAPDTREHITGPFEVVFAHLNDDEGNLPLQLPDQPPNDGHQELPSHTRPPEGQPELRQLTDSVREERDRAQSLCSAHQVTSDAPSGGELHLDQFPSMFNDKSSLDILIITSFRTFDGGGHKYTLHVYFVYCAAVPASKLRTELLIQHSTQSFLVI